MEGLDLSSGGLIAGMLVSTIGFGIFLYGKKATEFPQILTGLAMMGFPTFVHGAAAILAIGGGLVVGLWAHLRYAD